MKFRSVSVSVTAQPTGVTPPKRISMRVAEWLLDSPRLGENSNVKHLAGRLLKQPAREGIVAAQSRLGQLMCRECGNARDRRIGQDLLRQAARAGDRRLSCPRPDALVNLQVLSNGQEWRWRWT
jgi:hypothetical protein